MVASNIERILSLLREAHGEYFGEPVTQLDHALQCAQLAAASGADDDLVLAALLHDVGHLLEEGDEAGVIAHDHVGAHWLRGLGVGERVADLVGGHVQAKRYLTATNPAYYDRLSDASRLTLSRQGGPMSGDEAGAFEQDPLFAQKLRLRSWDEQAKVPGMTVAALDSYRELLERQ